MHLAFDPAYLLQENYPKDKPQQYENTYAQGYLM